jgi:hypothetical protein
VVQASNSSYDLHVARARASRGGPTKSDGGGLWVRSPADTQQSFSLDN